MIEETKTSMLENYKDKMELVNLRTRSSKDVKATVDKAISLGYKSLRLRDGDIPVAVKHLKGRELNLVASVNFPTVTAYRAFEINPDPRLRLVIGTHNRSDIGEIRQAIRSGADELEIPFPLYWYARGCIKRIHWLFSGIRKNFKGKVTVACEVGTVFNDRVNLYEMAALIHDSGLDGMTTNSGFLKQDYGNLLIASSTLNILLNDMTCDNFSIPEIKAYGGIKTEMDVEKLFKLGISKVSVEDKPVAEIRQEK